MEEALDLSSDRILKEMKKGKEVVVSFELLRRCLTGGKSATKNTCQHDRAEGAGTWTNKHLTVTCLISATVAPILTLILKKDTQPKS